MSKLLFSYEEFRHVETLFVQDNQVRTDQNKPPFLLPKKEVSCDQYELDYLGQIKFLHVEMPYRSVFNFLVLISTKQYLQQ